MNLDQYINAYAETVTREMNALGYDFTEHSAGLYTFLKDDDEHTFHIYKRECGRIGFDVQFFSNGFFSFDWKDNYPSDLCYFEQAMGKVMGVHDCASSKLYTVHVSVDTCEEGEVRVFAPSEAASIDIARKLYENREIEM